jgi:hypothetical protein
MDADNRGVSPLWHMCYSLLFESVYAKIRRTLAQQGRWRQRGGAWLALAWIRLLQDRTIMACALAFSLILICPT